MAGKYGDFSYRLYIYAFPVQQTIVHFCSGISVAGMFLLTISIVILLSFLSLKLIELNALKLKKVDILGLIYKKYQNITLKLKRRTGK